MTRRAAGRRHKTEPYSRGKGDSPIFADHRCAAVPAKIGTVPSGGQRQPAIAGRLEWAAFAVMCLLALWLNFLLYCHTMAFWRDECSAIQLASAPNWSSMWTWLTKDSFPALFSCLLRLWISLGPGASDAGIRLFGACTALALIAALFVSGRMMAGRVPLLALALVAFNATVFYYDSSIRAYGLAALFIVLCFAVFWRMLEEPTRWNVAASFLLFLASWHVNYQNTYILFGIVAAAAIVCAVCRLWKRCALVLGMGFVAALSMLIYVPIVLENRSAQQVTSFETDFGTITGTFAEAVTQGSLLLSAAWLLLIAAAGVFLVLDIVRYFRRDAPPRTPSRSLFCLLATVIAIISGIIFFKMHGMKPWVWHYTPLIAVLGILVEVGAETARKNWMIWARIVAAVGVVALSLAGTAPLMTTPSGVAVLGLPGTWAAANMRRTNMDLVCQALANQAGAKDFVLVMPFFFSPAFNYYYHGPAPWDTLPTMPAGVERNIVGYLAVKQSMVLADPIDPTISQIQKTLASGGRLWIVGNIQFPQPNMLPPLLPPAPLSPFRWNSNIYVTAWSMQVGYYLQTHARLGRIVPVEVATPVSSIEAPALVVFEGYRGP